MLSNIFFWWKFAKYHCFSAMLFHHFSLRSCLYHLQIVKGRVALNYAGSAHIAVRNHIRQAWLVCWANEVYLPPDCLGRATGPFFKYSWGGGLQAVR